jgi:hypothetical protein
MISSANGKKSLEGKQCPTCKVDGTLCPRCDAYRCLPQWAWLQAFITFVYGVPYPGQKPLFKNTRASILFTHYLMLFGSVGASCVLICLWFHAAAMRPLLFVAIVAAGMVTTGRLRACRHFILHHASHGDFGPASRVVGEVATLIAGNVPLDDYKPKHEKHHNDTAEEDDPELVALSKIGFVPGLMVNDYWKRLRVVMLSPWFFFLHLKGRLDSNFSRTLPLWRRVVFGVMHGVPPLVVGALSYRYASPVPIAVYLGAWLLPWTVGTYWSQIPYTLGLHMWWLPTAGGRAGYVERTGARFFGDPCPSLDLPFLRRCFAWGWWLARFLMLHLLVSKLFIVSGDNQTHDAHHMNPRRGFDWLNSVFDRQRLVETSHDAYWHTWSFFPAIQKSFELMSSLPPRLKAARSGSEVKEAFAELE